jgi:hypothetical protein
MGVVKGLCCAGALTGVIAPGARADEWNKKTILTFSGPVQVPGATLPAGSYVFKLADIPGNRHVVQVFDKDEKKIYTTLLSVPNQRSEPSDKPVILFSERATGSPQAVKVWYYPGDTIGDEFVYPKTQAIRIAKETHSRVLATNDDTRSSNTAGEIPVEMKSAALGHFDENGNWESDADKPVVMSNSAANAKADTSAQSTPAAGTTGSNATSGSRANSTMANNRTNGQTTNATAGTSGSRPARRSLPRTASSLALFELISGLSLAGGFALRSVRARL